MTRQPQWEHHPDAIMPDGYEWMLPGEVISKKCGYNLPNSPRWYRVTVAGGAYRPGYHPAMIQKIKTK